MSEFEHKDAVVKSINAIKNGPRAMQLYMDICAKCGTCAENCHVYYADPRKETNPAARSDLIRNMYKKHNTITGKLLRKGELTEADFEGWVRSFYECSGCRRCAVFCPYGIDNSVLTRKGRAIIHSLGMSPVRIADTQDISDKFGNDEAQPPRAIRAALEFLEEEIEDETGVKVSIPVDQEADIVFVPASADLISFPETQMGVAYFFHLIGASWTMATDAVDGANFGLFSGDDAHMKRKNKLLHDACLKYKAKMLIIGECGHAYRIAKRIGGANYWGDNGKLPYEITNIFSFAAPYFKDGTIKLDKTKFGKSVTYHDPCNFGRSTGVTEEPRELLNLLVDDFREMTPNRAHNWCCGGGGGLAVMDGKEGVKAFGDDMTFLDSRMTSAKKKVEQVKETGAEYMAAPCANCKRHVGQMLEHYETGVESGGVFDILLSAAIPPK
jgi:Fe-S oxidoreductase